MNKYTRAVVLNGQARITFIVAFTLTIFMIAITSVSNSSMFAAARGGLTGTDYRYIWERVDEYVPVSHRGTTALAQNGQPPHSIQNDKLLNYVSQGYNPEIIPGGLYILLPISMFGGGGNILSLIGSGLLFLDGGQVYRTGNTIHSIGDPGNMDPDSFRGTSFGDSKLQNEEAEFQDNLKNAIIHHGI